MAQKLAKDIARFGADNVQVIQSDATPEELAAELEQLRGKTYDLDAEQRTLQGIDPSELVGGSTGSAGLDHELLALQQEAATGPQPTPVIRQEPATVTYGEVEEVGADEAMAALLAEMDALGI